MKISAAKNQQAGRNQPSTATITKGSTYGAAPTKKVTNSSRRGLNKPHNHNTAARSHGAGGFCAVENCRQKAVCELAVDGEWFPICQRHSVNRFMPRRALKYFPELPEV